MPTEPESLHLQCRHIFPDGHRCGSKCLRREPFCYYHHTTRRPRTGPALRDTLSTFDLPLPDDRSSIQAAIGLILQRLAGGGLDTKRAGLLLYGLQIASMNLPKPSATPIESVDEVIEDPTHGPIAPEAEMYRAPHEKTLEEILLEQWNLEDDRNPPFPGAIYRPAVPAAWLQPESVIPTLQATAECRPNPRYTASMALCRCTFLAAFFASALLAQTTPQPTPPVIAPPSPAPTRAEVLRGAYGPDRANNDLLYYHLDIRVDPVAKTIAGKNTIRFKMLQTGTRIQLDLSEILQIDKILFGTEPLKFSRDSYQDGSASVTITKPSTITTVPPVTLQPQ